MKSWDVFNETTSGSLVWTELETELCTELNDEAGSNDKSPFYKTIPMSQPDLSTYGPKLKCVRPGQNVTIFGNYDTNQASSFMVVFEKCDSKLRATCRDENEISEWLEFKYFIIVENSRRFVPHLFENERIAQFAQLSWIPVSNQVRKETVKYVTRSNFLLNDYKFNVGSLRVDNEQGFNPEKSGNDRLLPYKNRMWNSITYEMSLT